MRSEAGVLLVLWLATATRAESAQPCQLFDSRPGTCERRSSCPQAASELEKELKCPTKCPTDRRNHVCCPSKTVAAIQESVSQRKCREYSRHVFTVSRSPLNLSPVCLDSCVLGAAVFVIGGVKAKPKELPHMAAVGWGDESAIEWNCGGSLISERFVLTAAHCLYSEANGLARWVRLGDLNINSDVDDASAQLLSVVDAIPHPDFIHTARYNDIGLLKVNRDVSFDEFVRPACLNKDEGIGVSAATASGWGRTETLNNKGSDHLMRVRVTIKTTEDCVNAYKGARKLKRGIDGQSMMCAGEEAKDTCLGDSGGPLQVISSDPYCMIRVVGLTSFGSAQCGGAVPGVYTKVSHFVPWLEKIVWPDQ